MQHGAKERVVGKGISSRSTADEKPFAVYRDEGSRIVRWLRPVDQLGRSARAASPG
jgi:hypothetical protein